MSDEPQSNPEPQLTDKQKEFINQYFLCGFNATEAAKRAGYQDPEQSGYENKRKLEIRAEIDRRMAEHGMSANEVIARLADQARGSMADFISPSGRGWKIDLKKARQNGKLHLLKSYSKVKGGAKIELYDAHAALVDVGKHLKLNIGDDVTVTVKVIKGVSTDEI
jgi:hypothetical protein